MHIALENIQRQTSPANNKKRADTGGRSGRPHTVPHGKPRTLRGLSHPPQEPQLFCPPELPHPLRPPPPSSPCRKQREHMDETAAQPRGDKASQRGFRGDHGDGAEQPHDPAAHPPHLRLRPGRGEERCGRAPSLPEPGCGFSDAKLRRQPDGPAGQVLDLAGTRVPGKSPRIVLLVAAGCRS